jgi:hypothetical protein
MFRHLAPLLKMCLSFLMFFYTDPHHQHCPTEYYFMWTEVLRSCSSWFLTLQTARIRGRERPSLSSDHQCEQNSELSSRAASTSDLSDGNPRSSKVGRLSSWRSSSKDSGFSQPVLWCLHEEGLVWIWVGRETFKHPEKDMIQVDLFLL